jgi:hypothetical protein
VTKTTRHENSSTFSTLMVIELPDPYAYFSLSARRAQSTFVAKATRQENSIRSFKILMAIGPPYAASSPPVAHDNTLAKQ